MSKILSNEKFLFFIKVIAAHVVTYIIVGALAAQLFNYESGLLEIMGFKPLEEISFITILAGQVLRGVLLGIVVWWLRDGVLNKKLAWLKLWAILVILGVFNTYGPVSGSIEGFIYLDFSRYESLPPLLNLSVLEVLTQPLLFSMVVTYKKK